MGVRPTAVSYQAYSRRWKATVSETGNTTTGGEEEEENWLEKARKRSWLWRWLNDIHEIEAQVSLIKVISPSTIAMLFWLLGIKNGDGQNTDPQSMDYPDGLL